MESFKLIGLKLKKRTKNANGQSGKDCGELWQYFEEHKIADQVPNKESNAIYAVYYDYESDEKGLFSYFIGCKVDVNTVKPENLDELIIPPQSYYKEIAKGQMTGCISDAWSRIWNSNLNRKFAFDFEVYDERSFDWNNAHIDIFISITD